MRKTYASVGEDPAAGKLRQAVGGELRYAVENSATFPALGWQSLAAPPPAPADAELEEIVILGRPDTRIQYLHTDPTTLLVIPMLLT